MAGRKIAVSFDPLFRDGAVLQRNQAVSVWGVAPAGERVTVVLTRVGTINRVSLSTVADDDGRWTVTLPAHPEGGPYSLRAFADGESCEAKDVLFGDVWVLGGQSNMWLWMDRVAALYPGELDGDLDSTIRFFLVPQEADFVGPRTATAGGSWLAEGRDDVSGVSAAGHFFAKHLRERVAVPLGFVQAAIGGTPIEPWLSEPYLRRLDLLGDDYDQWRQPGYAQRAEAAAADGFAQYVADADARDRGLGEHWEDPGFDDGDWDRIELAEADFAHDPELGKPGIFWFRKTIDVPAGAVGRPAQLRFGTLVDADDCYVNGELIGHSGYRFPPRNYRIAALPARMTIAFRLRMNSGIDGGFTAGKRHVIVVDPSVPTDGSNHVLPRRDGSVPVVWPSDAAVASVDAVDAIDVDALGPWAYRRSASLPAAPGKVFPTRVPAGCYNAMIAPLARLALTGVLWYQGETNASRGPNGYADKMMALIQCWRDLFARPDLPFIYAQLPNLSLQARGYARLRDEQRRALALDHTAMIVTLDAGESNDLHPINKDAVGQRFAVAAEALAYGFDGECMGPLVSHAALRTGGDGRTQIVVRFTHCGSGLRAVAADGAQLVDVPFAVVDAAAERPQLAVTGHIAAVGSRETAGEVVIAMPDGWAPSEDALLRYAWGETVDPVLRNGAGLLASPFEVRIDQ